MNDVFAFCTTPPTASRIAFVIFAFAVLSACEQNTFVPPPPPKVEVAPPAQKQITRYLDATGNTAPVKSVDLVARVQGFLQSINYKDGNFVKEGTTLFTIEPETYKLKLEQAQAAEAGAQSTVKQAEADYKRQVDWCRSRRCRRRRWIPRPPRATTPRPVCSRRRSTPRSRRSTRLYQGHRAVRRRRHRASGLGRRTRRRGLADAACHHRGARSDLCEFQRQ